MKQRYYPMLGLGSFGSASRFCAAFDELRHYLRVRRRGEGHVSLAEQLSVDKFIVWNKVPLAGPQPQYRHPLRSQWS